MAKDTCAHHADLERRQNEFAADVRAIFGKLDDVREWTAVIRTRQAGVLWLLSVVLAALIGGMVLNFVQNRQTGNAAHNDAIKSASVVADKGSPGDKGKDATP